MVVGAADMDVVDKVVVDKVVVDKVVVDKVVVDNLVFHNHMESSVNYRTYLIDIVIKNSLYTLK